MEDNATIWWCEDAGVRITATLNDVDYDIDWFDDTSASDTDRLVEAIMYVRAKWAPFRGLFAVAWPEFVDEAQRRADDHGAGMGNHDNWLRMPLERRAPEDGPEQEEFDGERAPEKNVGPDQHDDDAP
jgi:hypothetical protein